MLLYLVSLARSDKPVAARRRAIALLVLVFVISTLVAVLSIVVIAARNGRSSPGLVFVLLAIIYLFFAVFFLVNIPLFCLPRWRREGALETQLGRRVHSVYLTSEILRYVESNCAAKVNPYAESVSVVLTPAHLEFWAGGAKPALAVTLRFADISSLQLSSGPEGFPRPELSIDDTKIPLYAATGWLGISRTSSRRLYDQLRAGLTNSMTGKGFR